MVARTHRLSREADFRRLFARGNRSHTSLLSLVVVKNGMVTTRYAVVVATTVAKRATIRNLLRRRLSEHVRLLLPTIVPGYDCAFVVRPPATKASSEALRSAGTTLLRRVGLLPPYQP